jgi:hypothetical protein
MTMTQAHLSKDKSPPLWAILGAPLIGVPIMVALLALGAPQGEVPSIEAMPVQVTEPVDTHVVESVSNDTAAQLEQELNAG